MAGTRCTVPTAQSASSTYRKEGRRKGVLYLEERALQGERELNKEGKKDRKARNSNKNKEEERV